MVKAQFNCRLERDIAKWISDEAERLTKAQGTKYSQADVVTRLVVRHGKPQPSNTLTRVADIKHKGPLLKPSERK